MVNSVYELPQRLQNDLRFTILGNQKITEKSQNRDLSFHLHQT